MRTGSTQFNKDKIKHENLYFPEHLTADFLEETFHKQGVKVFANQYMLDTTAAVENALPYNKIDWFYEGDMDVDSMVEWRVMSDFAYVKSRTATNLL